MALSEKQLRKRVKKLVNELLKNFRAGKQTAQISMQMDALGFEARFPRVFRDFQHATHIEGLLNIAQRHSKSGGRHSEFGRTIDNIAQSRVMKKIGTLGYEASVQDARYVQDQLYTGELLNTILEMASTAKGVIEPHTTVGLSHDFIASILATDFSKSSVGSGAALGMDEVEQPIRNPFPGTWDIRLPDGFYLAHQWQSAPVPLEIVTMAPMLLDHSLETIDVEAQNWSPGKTVDLFPRPVPGFLSTIRSGISEEFEEEDVAELTHQNLILASMLPLASYDRDYTLKTLEDESYFPYIMSDYIYVSPVDGSRNTYKLKDIEKIIYGTLLYLNTPNPSLVNRANRQPVPIQFFEHAPDQARRLPATFPKRINIDIVEDSEQLPPRHSTAYQTVVKGYWYRQTYGSPKRKLSEGSPFYWHRRPAHVRNPGAPAPPRKDYEIEGLESGFPPGYGWSCDEIATELWNIQGQMRHVERTLESNRPDQEYTRELEAHLEQLEDEYEALYEVYEDRCGA